MSNENANPEDLPEQSDDVDQDQTLSADELLSDGDVVDTDFSDPKDARIAELEAQLTALKDQAMRALADAENTRRRAQREVEQSKRYAAGGLARDLLTVLDNLGRALEAAPDRQTLDDTLKNLVVGVDMTDKEMISAFEKHGIKRVDPLGQKFDPNFHEAMFEIPDSGKPSGTVVQVVAPGYVLHDRLLRAAMVGVAKGGPAPEDHTPVDTTA